ncbi:MAG: 3-hydroxyacyl-CoA dehydrogenase NAD-binding domain-containing protein, partial [Pseudomonadota bacterium]
MVPPHPLLKGEGAWRACEPARYGAVSMAIKKVFIVGSGLMGSGIAQVCASAGLSVTLCDNNSTALEKAKKSIAWSVGK